MLQKSTKIIAFIGGLFCVASVIAFCAFFFIVENQKVQFRERSTERAQAQANKESLASLIAILEATEDARASLRTRIIEEEKVIDLLAQIESIGKQEGTELTTNSLTVEPIDDSFETLVIQMSVEGSYSAVLSVLKLLEQLPYQSSVRNVQMVRNLETWTGTFVVRVTKFKNNEV